MVKSIATIILSFFVFQLNAAEVVPGEFIIKLKPGVKISRFMTNSTVSSTFPKSKRLKTRMGNVFLVKAASNVSLSAVKRFRTHPAIEYIEPNYVYYLPKHKADNSSAKKPGDKLFKDLWGLYNEGDTDINALEAWTIGTGSKDVIVAVTDTGIDLEHPDLKGNLWVNMAEKNGKPGVDDDGNGYVDDINGYDFIDKDSIPEDGHSHGTHCSGTIAAVHDDVGVAGVAANAQIMASKIFNARGRTNSAAILEAIGYSVDNGAHIISASWGGGPFSKALFEKIKYANEKGTLFVAAAGNSYADADKRKYYPMGYDVDNIIAVGAYDINGKKAGFSNYGQTSVDVFAPGKDIMSTVINGGYKKFSGTSMATPHVSGMIAVLLSLNPKWLGQKGDAKNVKVSPLAIKKLLIDTSIKTESLKGYSVSNGRVNFQNLLQSAEELIK